MSFKIVRSLLLLTLIGLELSVARQLAAQQEAASQTSRTSQSVAARVDGQPIGTLRLEHELKRLQRTRPVRKQAQVALRAQLLDQVVNQLLILGYLQYTKQSARSVEVDLAIENLQKRIEQKEETLEQYLQKQGLNQLELRQKIGWQISWSRYLNRYLTEKNYQSYFDQHRRDFDGTQLRVAHVLLTVNQQADSETVQRQEGAIKQIRGQIVSGKITFAEAAKQFSQSPTAQQGGDLGWIERREPMSEEFSAAAFQLKKGEVSFPVRSPFGFHLITCLDVKVGAKNWQQAGEPLREAITGYLFQWTAQQQRKQVRLEFTGSWPYFHPQTRALVKSAVSFETGPAPKGP